MMAVLFVWAAGPGLWISRGPPRVFRPVAGWPEKKSNRELDKGQAVLIERHFAGEWETQSGFIHRVAEPGPFFEI